MQEPERPIERDWRVRAIERFSGPLWIIAIVWAFVHMILALTDITFRIANFDRR